MATPRSASGVTDGNRLLARPWLPGVELFHADFSGQPFGRHSHDAFAIGAILHGVGGYQCRGARHALPAGTLSLMNPQEPHTGHAESPRLIYRMLYIEEARLPALLGRKQLPRGFRQLNPTDDGAVAACSMARRWPSWRWAWASTIRRTSAAPSAVSPASRRGSSALPRGPEFLPRP